MEIEKIWINKKEKEHNFILFCENTLYTRKSKKENWLSTENEINKGKIPKNFVGLPISYIRNIEFRENDDHLRIQYQKDSEDEVEISNVSLRREIFDYLKENTAVKVSKFKNPSIFSRIKKPLIALGVIVGVFVYVLVIISSLNSGIEFETRGRPGLGTIVLALAQLGLVKNIVIFSPLTLIALYRIIVNYKNDTEVHSLIYRK